MGRTGTPSATRLVLDSDDLLSRDHARIVAANGFFEVHDLDSRNGTYVNGMRVSGVAHATSGDCVFVGRQTIILGLLSAAAHNAIREDARSPLMTTPTASPRLALLHRQARRAAAAGQPLLFFGGPGTGKSSYARAVHRVRGRTGEMMTVDAAVALDLPLFRRRTGLLG
jgi:ABC transport system ATP-binding/permease protein